MTTSADNPALNYRFADLTLDVARRWVTRQGQPIELKALDFDLLRFLVEQAPNVVNADVLAEKVWGRHFVSPENVAQRVMLLRQSLADDAAKPRYIETVRNKGYRLVPLVERVPIADSRLSSRPSWVKPAIGAGLLASLGFMATAAYWFAGSAEQPAPPDSNSIAVLPFENLSPNPDDALFVAGMQDDIVSQLTKLRGIQVIAVRPPTGAPESVAEMVRDLNVATTLGGKVYYSDGRLKISPHLNDAATGKSRWANTYERERRDIFAIQREIALEMAHELSVELTVAERARIERPPTTDAAALEAFLRARTRFNRVSRDEMLSAIAELEEALTRDEKFTDAWVLLSQIHTSAQFSDPENLVEHQRKAKESAQQAVELDPNLAMAHNVLALTLATTKDFVGAASQFEKARRLNGSELPDYVFLRLSAGNFDAFARGIFEQARAANHQAEVPHRMLAYVYAQTGDWDKANEVFESALSLFAKDDRAVRAIQESRMHLLVGRGDLDGARAAAIKDPIRDSFNAKMLALRDKPGEAAAKLQRELEDSAQGNPNHRRDIALWAGHFGEPKLAFEAMRSVVDAQSGQMIYVWMPQFSGMRRLPEFKEYMRKIGIVAYWEKYGWPIAFCHEVNGSDFECN